MRRHLRSRCREEDGQSLLETALMIPVIFTVVFWVFELSWLMFTFVVLANAANEGVHIVRIGGNWQNDRFCIGADECHMTQLRHDLLAENESDRLGRLCDMTVRSRRRPEQRRMKERASRAVRNDGRECQAQCDRRRSDRAAAIETECFDQCAQRSPA